MKVVFMVMGLYSEVEVMGRKTKISEKQPELAGFLPVFKTEEAATKFCGGRFAVLPMQVPKVEVE